MKIKVLYTLRKYTHKKGTKAVTGAVPFQAFVPKECILVP